MNKLVHYLNQNLKTMTKEEKQLMGEATKKRVVTLKDIFPMLRMYKKLPVE